MHRDTSLAGKRALTLTGFGVPAAVGLDATLYPHQKEGVSWMLACELRGQDLNRPRGVPGGVPESEVLADGRTEGEETAGGGRGDGARGGGGGGGGGDGGDLPPLWQRREKHVGDGGEEGGRDGMGSDGQGGFCDVITNRTQASLPPPVLGGIVAGVCVCVCAGR